MSMMFEGITIDHKIPRSLHNHYAGNIHDTDNLELICPSCNSMKGQRTLSAFLKELRERNAFILKLSAQTPQGEIVSPIYPHIGIGVEFFGDKSAVRYNPHALKSRHNKKRQHFFKKTTGRKPAAPESH